MSGRFFELYIPQKCDMSQVKKFANKYHYHQVEFPAIDNTGTMRGVRKPIVLLALVFSNVLYFIFINSNLFSYKTSENKSITSSELTNFTKDNKSLPLYLVNTLGCQIVDLDPFGWPVEKFSGPPFYQKCAKTFFKLEDQKLRLNADMLTDWKKKSNIRCCYQDISRVEQSPDNYNETADWGVKFSTYCHPFPISSDGILINNSYIKVSCKGISETKDTTEIHGTVLSPNSHSEQARNKAIYWETRALTGQNNPPSILVIGVDSVSRLHMIRKLPQTRKFLFSNDFIELKGYTRMGSYTFVNIMGGFAGLELNKYESCWPNQTVKLDDCPYIWKQFNELNYMSAYIEDSPGMSIFHSNKMGFVRAPTDYYPMTVVVAAHFHNGHRIKSGTSSCIGGYRAEEFHTGFIKDFVLKMGNAYPYFLFSWLTSASHSDFNRLQSNDKSFENLLSSVTNATIADPDNTVIIFMSDHGFRYGDFRQSFQGFFEENVPFFFIRLPKSLKSSHPEFYDNLKRNSAQLTSPYDLHSTFLQILDIASSRISTGETRFSKTFSTLALPQYKERYSFFEYIPENRTCASALISDRFCMCGVTPEEASHFYANFFEIMISHVNSLLQPRIDSGDCVVLSFSMFLYGRQVSHGTRVDDMGQSVNYSDHVVALEANPSKARFECRLRAWQNGSLVILGDVDRLNKYQGQSDCISETKLRPLCLCKNVTIID